MELTPDELATLGKIYPYARDPKRHPLAPLFFNGPIKMELDACEAWARHIFDKLDCSAPRRPSVKYDARGSSGAPWEDGVWIDADADRVRVHVTVQDKPVDQMTAAERAALRRDLDAAEVAARAGTLGDS